ncbi:MAG: hypothetical protein JW940_33915 [Polyangiaceae bacterium]|nr:hypothetical protein [Polyangiaceae bacterium]
MPTSWGLTEILLAIFLVGFPLAAVIGTCRGWLRDLAAARRQRRTLEERENRRRPFPGGLSIEGRVTGVESNANPPVLVVRRKHGCLGGPIVFDVSPLGVQADDGTLHVVELGPDPAVNHYELLPPVVVDPGGDGPMPSGAPDAVLRVVGRIRVEGLISVGPGRFAPPADHSATLTVLGADT